MRITYDLHRPVTVVPVNLWTCTWHYFVTWDGYLVAFTTWVTA